MSGIKHDQDKPDLSMVSLELVTAVARVRAFGAKKYSRDNWKNGFKVTRSCAAALRHIFQFLSGETLDSESGESHLAHAVCSLEHAIYDMRHRPELNDDRYNPEEKTQAPTAAPLKLEVGKKYLLRNFKVVTITDISLDTSDPFAVYGTFLSNGVVTGGVWLRNGRHLVSGDGHPLDIVAEDVGVTRSDFTSFNAYFCSGENK